MNRRAVLLVASLVTVTACGFRDIAPGHPPVDAAVIPPAQIMDFAFLYARNCAGCHGPDGSGGAAVGLCNPVYLAVANDATIIRITADGVPGTAMPAFAQHSGGMLTDDQINAIVRGMRTRWARPEALGDVDPPPHETQTSGDPTRGAAVYGVYCSSCHGADGRGGARASSIADASYLALVSNQNLRTTLIVGRPELGAPDWRGDVPGKPMSSEEISDVVAWLAAQRPPLPDQGLNTRRAGGGTR